MGPCVVPTNVSMKVCPLRGSSAEPRMKPGSEKDFSRLSRETDVFFSAPSTFRPPLLQPEVGGGACITLNIY